MEEIEGQAVSNEVSKREHFLSFFNKKVEDVPKVEVSEQRRKVMQFLNPIAAVASVGMLALTIRRWRKWSHNEVKNMTEFEKRLNTDKFLQEHPKVSAYIFSSRCLSTSIILVGSSSLATYFSLSTAFGIYSTRDFFVRTRVFLEKIFPNLSKELTKEQIDEEEQSLAALYNYIFDDKDAERYKEEDNERKKRIRNYLFGK